MKTAENETTINKAKEDITKEKLDLEYKLTTKRQCKMRNLKSNNNNNQRRPQTYAAAINNQNFLKLSTND